MCKQLTKLLKLGSTSKQRFPTNFDVTQSPAVQMQLWVRLGMDLSCKGQQVFGSMLLTHLLEKSDLNSNSSQVWSYFSKMSRLSAALGMKCRVMFVIEVIPLNTTGVIQE